MPDFRSLISRMADELDQYRQLLLDDRSVTHRLADEARAALAEPDPEGPSDQKLHGYWISTSPSGQLTRQQVDAFLDRHKDPEDARRFLQEAGLIDQYGELARPYRQEQS